MANFLDNFRGGGTGKGAYILQALSASSVAVTMQGVLGQTANIFEVKNSVGTTLFSVDNSGNVEYVGDETIADSLTVSGNIAGSGTLSITGDSTFGVVSAGATTLESLTVSGATRFVGDVVANHNLTVNNSLQANGHSYFNDLFINDTLGFGSTQGVADAKLTWGTADANANLLLLTLPEGDATNVPGFVVGDRSADGVDLAIFNGESHPFIGAISDAVNGVSGTYEGVFMYHTGDDAVIKTTEGNLYLIPEGADVNIGNGGTGGGDLFFNTPAAGSAKFSFREGASGTSEVYMGFDGNRDQFGFFIGATAGRQMIIGEVAGRNQDYDHAVSTNPIIFGHSALSPDVTNNEWWSLTHNQAGMVIGTGPTTGAGTGATTIDNYISFQPRGAEAVRISGTGEFETKKGRKVNRTAVNDQAYSILLTDDIIAYTAISAERIITLPTVATAGAGKVYHIVDESGNAGAFNIVIEGNGEETISGALNQTISAAYNSYSVYCTGAAWQIL